MTVKELSQAFWYQQEIKNNQQRLREMWERAASIHSPSDLKPPVRGGGSQISTVERAATEIADLEATIAEEIRKEEQAVLRIMRYIDALPDGKARCLCRARFLDGKSWECVAESSGYVVTAMAARKYVLRYVQQHPEEPAI
jgi:hypothetical protein